MLKVKLNFKTIGSMIVTFVSEEKFEEYLSYNSKNLKSYQFVN